MMRAAETETFEQNVHHVFLQLLPLLRTDDFTEGVTAFMEKRKPEFTVADRRARPIEPADLAARGSGDHPGDPPVHRRTDPRRRSRRRSCGTPGRAPSGSNRQPFRFLVLRDGPNAVAAQALLGASFRAGWEAKRSPTATDRHASPTRCSSTSTTSSRSRSSCWCASSGIGRPRPYEGASVYPACQNLLLAARALGYGGALTMWHLGVEAELRELLTIPDGRVVGLHHARRAGRPPRTVEAQAARRRHLRRRLGPRPRRGSNVRPMTFVAGSTRPPSPPRSRSAISPPAASSARDRPRTRRSRRR